MKGKISRREFGQLIGLAGGLTLLGQNQALADEAACGDISASNAAIGWDESQISYWVDGQAFQQTDIPIKGNLAILLKHRQRAEAYIDKVILTDANKKIVSARYYAANDVMKSGFLPYLIFNGINLGSQQYFLYIRLVSSGAPAVYRYTFTQASLGKSKLGSPDLPAILRSELSQGLNSFVSNPYFYTSKVTMQDMKKYVLHTQVISISPDNQFTILVNFLFNDVSPSQYMRYFIVTDPVGRILGLKKRVFGDSSKGSIIINALTEAERNQWGLTLDKVAKINDCPYVMVFADDVQSIIARTTIWFR